MPTPVRHSGGSLLTFLRRGSRGCLVVAGAALALGGVTQASVPERPYASRMANAPGLNQRSRTVGIDGAETHTFNLNSVMSFSNPIGPAFPTNADIDMAPMR